MLPVGEKMTAEVTIQELMDKERILELLIHYCDCMDAPEIMRAARDVYAPDAVDDHGMGIWKGSEEICRNLMSLRDRFEGTAHVLTNIHIELDGDSARSRSYVTAWHWVKKTGQQEGGHPREADFCGVGVYKDELRRLSDGWRITRRIFRPMVPGTIGLGSLPEFLMRRQPPE
jgi:hypothetical protein